MKCTTPGRAGQLVSRSCLGTLTYGTNAWRPWVMTAEAPRSVVRHAVELNINFFGMADL